MVAAAVLAIALPLLAGCAALLPEVAPATPASTAPARPPGGEAPATGSTAPRSASAAPADSAPSSEALAVLSTIPEPLAPGERVPPPERLSLPPSASVPADSGAARAPADSLAARADSTAAGSASAAPADSAHGAVPVPEPTQPLGDRPGTLERMLQADTTAAAPPSALPAAQPARPDTCFRVQIGARSEKAKAERLREAAASQLLVEMVIEKEHALYKVRSRDCLPRGAADALKARAVASGFSGAFRFVQKRP
jgi:hypothetical protein